MVNKTMMNVIDLDFDSKLQITINNKRPVQLTDLTLALLSVGQQFEKFIEHQTGEQYRAGSELYIKEVRSGSIIIDLVAQTLPVIPLFWSGGSLLEWANYAKGVIEWLSGRIPDRPGALSKSDLRHWNQILEPVAKDNGSQMNITVTDRGQVINQFFFGSEQANAAQNAISRELERFDEPQDHVLRKRVMIWYQTKFAPDSQTGDRAVIETITKAPLKVIFENNAVKRAMLAGDSRYDKPWHELAYVVDVQVQTIGGVPKVYTVLNYYDEETFDPAD